MVREMVEVKKQSDKSGSRSEQAAATRRRILDAALRLFSEYGYAGTTMQAIADGADVAVQTVYFVFHTKGELLRQLLKSVGGRPEDSVDTMERDWVHEAMTNSDGRRSVALMVEHGNDIYARIAPVWAAIGQAASVEPEVADVWKGIVEQRRQGIRRIIDSLSIRGQLREGLTVDRAADIVYGLHRPETFAVFVGECGWPVKEFKAWSYRILSDQLLSPQPAPDQDQPPTRGLTFQEALS
jgi:TetR/AcrR family transcriptional regulator, regulator of autoinduction and epiphytic fitness